MNCGRSSLGLFSKSKFDRLLFFHLQGGSHESHPRSFRYVFPASSSNLRKPFIQWLDVVDAVRGAELAGTMIDNLASLFPDNSGSYLWNKSPTFNHAIYQLLLHSEPFRGEPKDSREAINRMFFHTSSSQ